MHERNSGLAIRADRDLAQVHEFETGPSRHFTATHLSVAFGEKGTLNRIYKYQP